jgi:hypothetical protein
MKSAFRFLSKCSVAVLLCALLLATVAAQAQAPLPSGRRAAPQHPDWKTTNVGTLTQALYDEAKSKGWIAISMKNDWKRVFAFER